MCACEYSLCVQIAKSVIVLIKLEQTGSNRIKGKLLLNTGRDFSPRLSLSNLLRLPRCRDTQERHVEVISENSIEKCIMCIN